MDQKKKNIWERWGGGEGIMCIGPTISSRILIELSLMDIHITGLKQIIKG